MKKAIKLLSTVTLLGSLAAGAAFAAGALELPGEVTTSSIKVPHGDASPDGLAKLARIDRAQAEAAALRAQAGAVVKARLDNEDGYLVWQIDVKHGTGTTEIAVDAGNGKVLAAEAEDDDDHGPDHRERG